MAVTQKQIAQELGVSHQLVSFALNGGGTVAEKTRQEIVGVAERLGYRRNELARAMATGKNSTLGFLSHENDQTDHLMRVLAGAIDSANERGYFIKAMHNSGAADIRGVLERCVEWRVSGLLVMNLVDDALDRAQREAKRLQIPIVFIENPPTQATDAWVHSDDFDGLGQVIQHLVSLGHQDIAFLNGEPSSRLAQKREEYFRRQMGLARLAVNESWIAPSHWLERVDLIEAAARSLLAGPRRPTAVVCAGDPLAMVMIRVAQTSGLSLPRDLSITGFANFFLSGLTNPALTTVDQGFRAMGHTAVETLISLTSETDLATRVSTRQILPTRLIVRASTAPPAH